mgnify:CR=1 FL=1
MISYFKTIDGRIKKIEHYEVGCWINCIAPDSNEVQRLIDDFQIDPDFLRASLDEEESSHIDMEDGNTLIILDIPIAKKSEKNITYHTMPIGIMLTEKNVITVCLNDNTVIGELSEGIFRNIYTNLRTQFVLNIILRASVKYLQYLKQIDKISDHVERQLKKSMENNDLLQLLEVEKSLVYFSSSLKANEATLEKIMRGRRIKLYEEDQELLDDVLIEVRQAIEMSNIHINILNSTMDTMGSIISNNLNVVMKILASITIIMSVPTIISGIWGMNVDLPFQERFPWFPWMLIGVFTLITIFILKKKKLL